MSSIMQMIFSTITAVAATTDSFFNRVSLLLSGNGPNNATNNTFIDSSASALTVTRGGVPGQGSFSPYAQTGWSVNFGAANGNKLTFPTQIVGTTLYTIECWIKPEIANTVNTYSIVAGNIASLRAFINAGYKPVSFHEMPDSSISYYIFKR